MVHTFGSFTGRILPSRWLRLLQRVFERTTPEFEQVLYLRISRRMRKPSSDLGLRSRGSSSLLYGLTHALALTSS